MAIVSSKRASAQRTVVGMVSCQNKYYYSKKCIIYIKPFARRSYLIEGGVVYLCLTELSYPKKLAFSFLHDLQVVRVGAHASSVDL